MAGIVVEVKHAPNIEPNSVNSDVEDLYNTVQGCVLQSKQNDSGVELCFGVR